MQPYSRFTDKGPGIAEPVIISVRNFFKKCWSFKQVTPTGQTNYHLILFYIIMLFIAQRNGNQTMIPKKQMKKKSIPIFKIEELDKNQNMNWDR